jgi:hypothetical protein
MNHLVVRSFLAQAIFGAAVVSIVIPALAQTPPKAGAATATKK